MVDETQKASLGPSTTDPSSVQIVRPGLAVCKRSGIRNEWYSSPLG